MKPFSSRLHKAAKKSSRRLLICTAILSVSLSALTGCSVKVDSADAAPSSDANSLSDSSHSTQDSLPDTISDEPIDLSDESWSITTLAYIQGLENGELAFDAIEWVEVPSERAKELGIEEEHLDSGFYIHNEAEHTETLPLSEECKCILLDWTDSYNPVETAIKDLPAILNERKDLAVPYELTMQGQKIINIQEHYVP